MTRTPLSSDLARIIRSVRVSSPMACWLDGRPLDLAPLESAGGEPRDEFAALAETLTAALYQRMYTRGGPPSEGRFNVLERREHVARLSRANCGRGTWDPDWRLRRHGVGGRSEVRRDGVSYWTDAVRPAGVGCLVRVPKELRALHPGFYTALGDAGAAPRGSASCVLRLYWHLRSDGAEPWLRALTRGLNRKAIPFRAKAVDSPRDYRRADAGVLYLEPRHYAAARPVVRVVYREVRETLRPAVPRLTLRLAPGLGLAEGPNDGSSFGEHRCRLIAGALVAAFEAGVELEAETEGWVARAFREARLDPRQPYRAAGSRKVYRPLSPSDFARAAAPLRGGATAAPGGRSRPLSLLQGARRIGDALCRDAVWHEERCNWVGRSAEEEHQAGPLTPIVAALDPTLYGGTAGVGLFLARLFAETGDAEHRRTALGALRQAVAAIRDPRFRSLPLSVFAGPLGVAWAARQAAELTGCAEPADDARALLSALLAEPASEHLLDVVGGAAGAVPVLLELHRVTTEPRFLRVATMLGEEICGAAIREGEIWRWDNQRAGGICGDRPSLTGFSHGAAGIGAALAALYAATAEPLFLAGARGAFAYEDGLFDERRGNWPDFTGKRLSAAPRYVVWWAHGAAGIALARLQAMALVPELEPACARSASAALATTRRALDDGLGRSGADCSLCLGLAGLIEVLAVAGELLACPEHRSAAERAMGMLLEWHGARRSWPSGVPSRGRNPSLMLGEAGVGYTLLRLRDPRGVASVLLPGGRLNPVASR